MNELPGHVTLMDEEGEYRSIKLRPGWVVKESEFVYQVHVRWSKTKPTILGRIDTREHVYHLRHQALSDLVHRITQTVVLGIEELTLASRYGALWVQYFDEDNDVRYRISMEEMRKGHIEERPMIGWRWITDFAKWEKDDPYALFSQVG